MNFLLTLFTFVAFLAYSLGDQVRYDGYKVLEISPHSLENVEKLAQLKELLGSKIDFWSPLTLTGRPVHIMVHPDHVINLKQFAFGQGMTVKTLVHNVQDLVDMQKNEVISSKQFQASDATELFTIDQYHSTQEIYDWMDSLASRYSSIVSTVSVGKSHEGKDLKVIKIGKPGTNKPGYWIDGGLHAREWIGVATASWIINELVTKYDSDADLKKLVGSVDFYIMPVFNVDGYEYTRNNNRMWRKTRSGPRCHTGWTGKQCCYGADGNRNWDYKWMVSGSSDNPCSDEYAGPSAFSEVEVKSVADFLASKKDTMKAYVNLHSYSEMWFYPYAYASHTYPPDVDELKSVTVKAVAAIKAVHGTKYEYGTPADILYDASGSTFDYAKGVLNIKYSYGLELRPGNGDTDDDQYYGFQLPASYIQRTAEETWAGLKVVAEQLL